MQQQQRRQQQPADQLPRELGFQGQPYMLIRECPITRERLERGIAKRPILQCVCVRVWVCARAFTKWKSHDEWMMLMHLEASAYAISISLPLTFSVEAAGGLSSKVGRLRSTVIKSAAKDELTRKVIADDSSNAIILQQLFPLLLLYINYYRYFY